METTLRGPKKPHKAWASLVSRIQRCAIQGPTALFEPPQFFKRQLFFNFLDIGTGPAAVSATRSRRRGAPGTC